MGHAPQALPQDFRPSRDWWRDLGLLLQAVMLPAKGVLVVDLQGIPSPNTDTLARSAQRHFVPGLNRRGSANREFF